MVGTASSLNFDREYEGSQLHSGQQEQNTEPMVESGLPLHRRSVLVSTNNPAQPSSANQELYGRVFPIKQLNSALGSTERTLNHTPHLGGTRVQQHPWALDTPTL
jgi:hypothetical protein